jgi:hypothetical protein
VTDKPNIILFMSDDVRWGDLDRYDQTPLLKGEGASARDHWLYMTETELVPSAIRMGNGRRSGTSATVGGAPPCTPPLSPSCSTCGRTLRNATTYS